jgi:PilZ domain
MEHRCGTRFAQSTRVIVETALGVSAAATLCDVSVSGALLRCALPFPLHGRVTLRFALAPGPRYSAPRVGAQVIRHCANGFAIEWLEFSPPLVWELLNSSMMPADEEAAMPSLPRRR